jgi:hypothetical protein
MGKVIEFTPERTLEVAQKCYLGFLNEFKEYYSNHEYTKAVDLLLEEIRLVSEFNINEYDLEILQRLEEIKEIIPQRSDREIISTIQNEIDIITKDLSI